MNRCSIATLAVLLLLSTAAHADIFLLANGGRVQGTLLNPGQSPRKTYQVQAAGVGQLTLAAGDVDRVLTMSELEQRYQELLPKLPDTEAAHWDMASKCEKAGLKEAREFHLEQVLRHNPDNEAARYALGYSKLDGRWQRQDDFMEQQGFVRHRGKWVLPQELSIETREDNNEEQVIAWRKKVKLWRTWIVKGRSHATEGQRNLQAIRDPRAADALVALLKDAQEPRQLKKLYIDVLGRFSGHATALGALIWVATNDNDAQVREQALDELAKSGSHSAVQAFIKGLQHDENKMVLRAAVALGYMKAPDSTLPLIDALITEHKRVIGGGGVKPTFGSGGGGLSVGGKPQVIKQKMKNEPVLHVLTAMYPGVNFGFDQDAWKKWFVRQNTPQNVNLRRSD